MRSAQPSINFSRLPKHLQRRLAPGVVAPATPREPLLPNVVYPGDARTLLPRISPDSIALSVWSPPYFVGKSYESHLTFDAWQALLKSVISLHYPIIKPGGFVVINIADILCFKDASMPRIQA